jgi:hypothetical protein
MDIEAIVYVNSERTQTTMPKDHYATRNSLDKIKKNAADIKPATDKQRRLLHDLGVPREIAETYTLNEAKEHIQELLKP